MVHASSGQILVDAVSAWIGTYVLLDPSARAVTTCDHSMTNVGS